jgi:hypothetical protein
MNYPALDMGLRMETVTQAYSDSIAEKLWHRLRHGRDGFSTFTSREIAPLSSSFPVWTEKIPIVLAIICMNQLLWVEQFSWKNVLKAICPAQDGHRIANLGGTGSSNCSHSLSSLWEMVSWTVLSSKMIKK